MAATPGYFITDGWVSRAEMYADGLEVPNFPVQTDQTKGRLWTRPGNVADILTPVRIVDTPIGARFAYGGITWQWPMVNLSPKMVSYIQTTYFQPNGTPSNFFFREWSNKVTVQTFNRASGEWETYHAWARFADFANEATPTAGGYTDLIIRFVAYEVAPNGPDLTPTTTIQSSPPYYELTQFGAVFNIQNVGDNPSLSNSQWEFAVPAQTRLESFSSSYPTTLEYSTDNGLTYVPIQPTDITTVTNIRGTLTTELEAGEATNDYSMVFTPLLAGNISLTVSVITDGDQNTGNDTSTDTITVLEFDPISLSPAIWLDGNRDVYTDIDALVPANNGDLVRRWLDQSGNNQGVTAGVVSERPVYVASSVNSQGGLSFDGLNNAFQSRSVPNTNELQLDMNHFIVYLPDNITPRAETLVEFGWAIHYKAPINLEDNIGIDGISSLAEFGAATLGAQILNVAVDTSLGNQTAVYRNGIFLGNGNVGSYNNNSVAKRINLGAFFRLSSIGNHFFQGVILEYIAYNDVITEEQRLAVEDYLKSKYNIP